MPDIKLNEDGRNKQKKDDIKNAFRGIKAGRPDESRYERGEINYIKHEKSTTDRKAEATEILKRYPKI